jgi:hypothetical protein
MDAGYFDFLVEVGDPETTTVFAEIQANSGKRFADYSAVIDWDRPLTEEQGAIVRSKIIPHEEKMARLTVIKRRQAKAQTFSRKPTRAGRIHAQGLGIKL